MFRGFRPLSCDRSIHLRCSPVCLPEQAPRLVAERLCGARLVIPNIFFVIPLRICFRERLDPLLRNDEWLGQRRVRGHQLRGGPLDPEILEDEWRDVSRREEDSGHAVAVKAGCHELAAMAGGWAYKREGVDARRLHARPVTAFSCLKSELCLVSFAWPVYDVTLGPRLVKLGHPGVELVLSIGAGPIVRVVRDDGLRTADYERVVGWGQLHVVVVDAAVPVLGTGAFDEAFWSLDRTDGADGREN